MREQLVVGYASLLSYISLSYIQIYLHLMEAYYTLGHHING